MVAKTEVSGRQKVFGLVLLCLCFPGLENGFLVLWGVFWAAESDFEVHFAKFGRLAIPQNAEKKSKREFGVVQSFTYRPNSQHGFAPLDRIGFCRNLQRLKVGTQSFTTAQKQRVLIDSGNTSTYAECPKIHFYLTVFRKLACG